MITGPYRTLKDLKDGGKVHVSKTSEEEDRKSGPKEDSGDEEE